MEELKKISYKIRMLHISTSIIITLSFWVSSVVSDLKFEKVIEEIHAINCPPYEYFSPED